MKRIYPMLTLALIALAQTVFAQNTPWQDANETSFKNAAQKRVIVPKKYRTLVADTFQLKQLLALAPMEFSNEAKTSQLTIGIPMPDGSIQHFTLVESPIMEPGLAAKFPNIKTYSGQGIEDKTATIKMDWTELGFHAMIYSAISGSISIDPYARGNKINYISYSKADLTPKAFKEEGVEVSKEYLERQNDLSRTQAGFCVGSQLRKYRLAVSCTGEYAVAVAGASPTLAAVHSAIVTTVNRVNGVYEKEASIRLVLIANNTTIEYLDANTDPFTGNNNGNVLINESQSVITSNIGSANFDIGHTFSTGGGGLAGLGVVCTNTQKARGITGSTSPTGDAYDIDYVAHEIGHQFGGNHTFNAITGNCSGNRNGSTAVEPGSGITIMGYAGICSATNDLAAHSIPYFHTTSLGEIGNYSNNSSGNTCAVTTATGNTPPVVNAGSNFTIPAGTPFILSGSATDANGDALTYSWEEIDAGSGSGGDWNNGTKPFFRSFAPTLVGTRYFPQLSDVANGTTTIGELLPTSSQTLNFRLTARDNRNGGGGVCSNEMVLTTVAGPAFTVTSQSTATSWTANGSNTATITWNVAGTNGSPFNTANVSILFSADGGLTFPYTLSSSTPNNGSATVTIPSIATTKGRVMVRAIGNVFFNMNAANITITNSSCAAEGAVISPTATVTAAAGSSNLNLSLSPQFSTAFSVSGSITSSDPQTNLAVFESTGTTCTQFSNPYSYKTHPFVVSVTGSYTFQRTGAGTVFNIYANSYDPASPCTNFLSSNFTNTVGTSATMTVTLTAGTPYILVQGVYWVSGSPAQTLPFAYSFAVTATPTGGVVYNGSGIYANPGAGYSYGYVIVDNATNTVKAISSTANLTNSTTYPNGTTYSVYGISYNTSQAAALNAYVGGTFTALTSGITANGSTLCANLSKNLTSVIVTAPVPVTFLALKARKQDKNVQLEWGTATEQNSDYFIIQRSADGQTFTTDIAKITAAGTSSSIKNYAVTDSKPLTGWNYYRVKQVDKDGKLTFSNVAAINYDKAASIMVVYPNPAKDKLTIEYTATKATTVTLQVLDSRGSLVLTNAASIQLGKNVTPLNVAALSKGVYILRTIDADGNVEHVKFIKE